ncbi:hypothetical protein V3C99_018726, partial [Haemonchus contortus]
VRGHHWPSDDLSTGYCSVCRTRRCSVLWAATVLWDRCDEVYTQNRRRCSGTYCRHSKGSMEVAAVLHLNDVNLPGGEL